MEIERIRKEINELLESVMEHSNRYSDKRQIPSLEISFVITKINKLQERLAVLKHLVQEQEIGTKNISQAEKPSPTVKEPLIEPEDKVETELPEIEEQIPEEDPVLSKNLEQPPISKLVDALTLNDRYLYANELFDKDMNSFNELVKAIDSSSSLNDAKSLFVNYNWDDENEHVMSFMVLVERRFS